jgi:hypothetical protein
MDTTLLDDMAMVGGLVRDLCHGNARGFFGFA